MTIMSMQPILSTISRLVKIAKMEPKLRESGTFFCPFDNPITRNIARNANPKNMKQVQGKLINFSLMIRLIFDFH